MKIFRGHGLCHLTAQSKDPENQQTDWEREEATPTSFVNALETAASEWYDNIKFFIHNGFSPETLDPKKRRALRLKYAPYHTNTKARIFPRRFSTFHTFWCKIGRKMNLPSLYRRW